MRTHLHHVAQVCLCEQTFDGEGVGICTQRLGSSDIGRLDDERAKER